MNYFSTRTLLKTSAAGAIAKGLAPDGGLFVPDQIPALSAADLQQLCAMDYRARAVQIMGLYLEEFSVSELAQFADAAYGAQFDDPAVAPVYALNENTSFLELWHGPTCAFKDMALQMLPYLLTASLKKTGETRQVCILVATSGDTGKAALQGFADVPGTKIMVFYPHGGVSDVQRLQMVTQQGQNVAVRAVNGNFDDAQTGVKQIFGDAAMAERLSGRGWFLSSANSINWGRLLPQIVYYISAYCDEVNAGRIQMGEKINFVVPTGNFGNILAGWYAKQMGLPVNRFVCASNENNVLTEFIRTGTYNKNRPFHVTASPSMDILVSSNLERLLFTLSGSAPETDGYMRALREQGQYTVSAALLEKLQAEFSCGFCDDNRTRAAIGRVWAEHHYLMDTHTAVAYQVLVDYRSETGDQTPAVVVSTASPFKFCDHVLRAVGGSADAPGVQLIDRLAEATGIPAPAPLAGLDKREVRFGDVVEKEAMPQAVEAFLA